MSNKEQTIQELKEIQQCIGAMADLHFGLEVMGISLYLYSRIGAVIDELEVQDE